MKSLVLHDVIKAFGGVVAVSKVTMEVEEKSIHGLIGPNGAGKTTLFNLITGVLIPNSGLIQFKGKDMAGLKPHERTGLKQLLIKVPFRQTSEERELRKRSGEILTFVGLYEKRDHTSSALPFGEQRRLEIARALATNPILLLLDEPCAGMNQAEKAPMIELIRKIRDRKITVIVIEHDIGMIAEICDTVTVLNFGVVIAHDSPESIQKNPLVIEAYLGREELAYG